jgi:hypothetical protein
MATVKNFGLAGIGSDVQFGKSGGRLIYDASSSFFKFTTDGSTLSNVRVASTPANANDATSKSYVDATKAGLDVKDSVRAATTAAGTLASDFVNGDAIDGITLATNDRILIKNQADASENGIYTVNASGAPTRATDYDSNSEVTPGAFSFVEEGTVNADTGWVLTNDGSITVGTTNLAFTQFSGAGLITAGEGLTKSGNNLAVNVDDSSLEINSDTLRIKTTYAGQTSITTLGTIATGTWNATDIGVAHGGTGSSTASGARTNLGLAIGSDVQAYDAQLASIAALADSDGKFIVGSASGFVAEDGNTARTSLGLGTGDTPTFTGLAAGGKITALTDPTNAQEAATKAYVDAATASNNELGELSDVTLTSPADGSMLLYDIGNSVWIDNVMSGDATMADTGAITLTDSNATRSNLGVAIGSDVQAFDAQLADVAGLAVTDGGIIVGDGSNFVLETGATARASLGLTIGTNVQAYDADLDKLAALSAADGNIIVGSASGWVAESGATARTSLGLGSIATQDAGAVAVTGGSITGVTTFTTGTLGSTATFNGNGEFTGNLTVGGNLTVSGSSITLDVGTVSSEDKYIQVNSGATSQETGLAGGLEVKRSSTANTDQFAFISFDDSTDSWNFKTGSANQAATSDATVRFGAIAAGTWNGTVIGRAYGGFGASISGHGNNSLVEADGGEIAVGSTGQYLRSDGTNFSASALAASDLSGTVSGANGGLGTNVSGFAASSIITTDGDGTVSELAKGSNSTVLKVSSGGTLQYAQADLTADVTGTLPVGNGGTGVAAVGTVNKFLMSTGSANQYNYVSALRDAAGKSAIEVSGTLTDNIKLVMTNTASNVTLTATDPDNGSANIDLVLKGQGDGVVVISEAAGGNSLVMGDDNMDLTVSGGAANSGNAGDAIIKGGNGAASNTSGDVIIRGGTGGSAEGKVKINDSSNNEIALFERTASAVNEISITNAATSNAPTISSTGDDTHISLALSPKGNGVVNVPAGYESKTITDDTLVTKAWVNANVVTDTDDLTLRAAITSGATTSTIGAMPNAGSTTYYVAKVIVHVTTAFSGASIDHVTLSDGTTTWVANADADITTAGTYVIDLPFATATAGGATFTLAYLNSGASAVTPTAGAGIVTVEYKATT